MASISQSRGSTAMLQFTRAYNRSEQRARQKYCCQAREGPARPKTRVSRAATQRSRVPTTNHHHAQVKQAISHSHHTTPTPAQLNAALIFIPTPPSNLNQKDTLKEAYIYA